MEAADRANANEAREADAVRVAEPEQHQDDETDSNAEDEEEEEEEEPIPTPDDEGIIEYTYPRDFGGRRWQDVVQRRYFRLIIDPACIDIPYAKFQQCKYLIEIVYPEGKDSQLLHIGYLAFEHCCNLQRMNPFPDGLVELDSCAFGDCCSLQGRITIPPSIQFVRGRCFAGCGAITSVVFESSTATTTKVVELHDGIFWSCAELRSVRLPNNLTVIPSNCFYGCCSLIDVPIPGTVRTIQSRAFADCALRAVDLPESVIVIGEKAYSGCSDVVSVTIRSSTNAVQLGRRMFKVCPSLSTIKMYPWHFPKIFEAMNEDASFIYKFFHQYHHQIQRHPQKKQRLQG